MCVSYSALFQAVGGCESNPEVRQTRDNNTAKCRGVKKKKPSHRLWFVDVVGISSSPVFYPAQKIRKKGGLIEMRPLRGGLNVS